jgi:opacity protein-like surface antigen
MIILMGSVWAVLPILLFVVAISDAYAETRDEEEKSGRLEDLEERVEILADEVGRLESIFAVPEETELESFSGLGPAASKVYKRDHGLSIGGYGEIRLRTFHNTGDDDEDDVFDALRAVLYVGYKFNENWVVNSEFEFEHAGTGGDGSVSAEFVTVDYLWKDEVNFRAGLVLVPMGLVNEIHEPTFFFGAERPEVERVILPSTWRENGVGIFGRIADRIDYRAYVINGFRGSEFSSSGLRGGRQKGSKALANDFAFVARMDVEVVLGLSVGGSIYTGQSGQEEKVGLVDLPDAQTTIYELHGQYKGYGASLRALWTEAFIDEAGNLSRTLNKGSGESIANHMRGWYVEAAYDILPLFREETRMSLEPYFRYERYDTQRDVSNLGFTRDKSKDIDLYIAGLQFKPIPQVVFKLDYRHFDPAKGDRADEVQALVGYVF